MSGWSGKRGGGRGGFGGRGGREADGSAAELSAADAEVVARELCLRLLTKSPRTRAQLTDALRRKGVPDEVVEAVLGRFSDVGLIDDEAFAQAWVQSRHNGRGLAPRALAAELRQRGVDDETVQEAVGAVGPELEEATARELVARKLAGTARLDRDKRTRRLVGMLARKGYSHGLAYRVVKEALKDEGAEIEELGDLDD